MYAVIETPTFVRLAGEYWNDEDRSGFINFTLDIPRLETWYRDLAA